MSDDTTPITRADLRRFGEAMRECAAQNANPFAFQNGIAAALATIPAASEAGACKRFVCNGYPDNPEARHSSGSLTFGVPTCGVGEPEGPVHCRCTCGLPYSAHTHEARGEPDPVTTAEVTDSGHKDDSRTHADKPVGTGTRGNVASEPDSADAAEGFESPVGSKTDFGGVEGRIFRKIYRGAGDHADYLRARFPPGAKTGLSFEFAGHRWAYVHSDFDDAGDFDLIQRPAGDAPGTSDETGGDATSEQRKEHLSTSVTEMVDAALSEAAASTTAQRKAEESAAFVSGSVGSFRCGFAAGEAVAGAQNARNNIVVSPVLYALLYRKMAEKAREMGYALAIHGSLTRDCDVVAVPWTDNAEPAITLMDAMAKVVGNPLGCVIGGGETKPHGRRCWTIVPTGGNEYFDFSVLPLGVDPVDRPAAVAGAHAFECEHHNDHETAHNDECVCRCGRWQDHRLHAAPQYPDPDGMPPLPTVAYKDPSLDVGYGLHPEQGTGWPTPGLVPLVSRTAALAREECWRRECARLEEELETERYDALRNGHDNEDLVAERDELRAKLAAVEEDTQELVSALGELRILAEGVIRERGPLGDKTVDRILRRAADALAKLAAAKEALA